MKDQQTLIQYYFLLAYCIKTQFPDIFIFTALTGIIPSSVLSKSKFHAIKKT